MNIDRRQTIRKFLNQVFYIIGLLSLIVFVARIGFDLPDKWNHLSFLAIQAIIITFCLQEAFRWFLAPKAVDHLKDRWFENLLVVLFVVFFIREDLFQAAAQRVHPNLGLNEITLAYLGISQIILLLGQAVRFFRSVHIFNKISLTTSQIFTLSFMVPILIGTSLLKLPKATVDGISWLDALFTATSAVCITGLTTLSVSNDFTPLGQIIICVLFQLGGLGIMTLTISFGILFSGGIGLKERMMMGDVFSENRLGEIGGLLSKITLFALSVEAIGAILLYWSLGFSLTSLNVQELYMAIFHAISAFCNAGFSLYDSGLATDVVANNKFYGSAIMAMVVIGAIGFPVIINLYDKLNPFAERKIHLKIPTKLILISTLLLIVVGGLGVWLSERGQSFSELSLIDQLYQTSFMSVASRTSGFNIWPTESLSLVTCMFVILLMWIGGSPMSTAGGIKNLTFAVAILAVKAIVTGKSHVTVFGREIYDFSIMKAFSIITLSILILFVATSALIILEPNKAPLDLLFEAVSAFGTVGLSRGVTPDLSEPSKFIVICLMFSGRIGIIVFLSSFFMKTKKLNYQLLKENIPIN